MLASQLRKGIVIVILVDTRHGMELLAETTVPNVRSEPNKHFMQIAARDCFQIVSENELYTGSLNSTLIYTVSQVLKAPASILLLLYICLELYHALFAVSSAPCLRLPLEECSNCSKISFVSQKVRLFYPLRPICYGVRKSVHCLPMSANK